MEKHLSNLYSQERVHIFLLLGFCFILYFLNLGQWDLWNPDEPRYAQVAREMVNQGDWILMHFNGNVYADKPPFFFWLIGLSSYLWQGFTSYSARFPSALFGTLTVILTFFIGKILYSSRTGFFSGLILATCYQFAYLATRANIDATLTFFTTASLFCFILWVQEGKGETQQHRRRGLIIYGFYIGMAFATLAKGPVGFLLPLFISLVYLLIQKDWKKIRGMKLLPGMLIFIAIVLCWYLPALLKGGEEYLQATLFKHSIDRYSKGWSHVRPIYYYFYNFPADFLPWTFFLPSAVAYGFSEETLQKRKAFLFLFIWCLVIFLFFTLSKGKRGLYLLPLFPAASLMIGKLWDDFILNSMEHHRRVWITSPLYALMGLMFVAGGAIPFFILKKFTSYLPYAIPMAILLLGGSLALFVLNRFKRNKVLLFLVVGIMAGGFFYTTRVVFPLVNPYKSARYISQEVNSRILPGEKLGIYGDLGTGPYNFYSGIVPILEWEKKEDLLRVLQSPERIFCLLRVRDLYSLQSMEGWPKVELIARHRVGNNDMALISNR